MPADGICVNPPAAALRIIGLLEAAGHAAYVVGGCVRDSMLGVEPNDWDITTSARPDQVKGVMAAADVKTADTGIKYGTITCIVEGAPYEVTTFRADGTYSDGRHPDAVELLESIDGDLSRRDFTVNAMAYNPKTGVIDLFGGRDDLKAGVLRCVGEPHRRFAEDALRIMRGLRFAATYGMRIEPGTAAAMHADRGLLAKVSAERIAVELEKLICREGALDILLEYPDVIAERVPQVRDCIGFEQNTPYHAYTVWEHCARVCAAAPADDLALRMAALFHDIGKPSCYSVDDEGVGHFFGHAEASVELFAGIVKELKLQRKLADDVALLIRYHDAQLPTTEAGWRRWAIRFGEPAVHRILELQACDARAKNPLLVEGCLDEIGEARAAFGRALEKLSVRAAADLAVGGRELIAAGIEPGPEMGKILARLLDMVVVGEVANEPAALLARVDEVRSSL